MMHNAVRTELLIPEPLSLDHPAATENTIPHARHPLSAGHRRMPYVQFNSEENGNAAAGHGKPASAPRPAALSPRSLQAAPPTSSPNTRARSAVANF